MMGGQGNLNTINILSTRRKCPSANKKTSLQRSPDTSVQVEAFLFFLELVKETMGQKENFEDFEGKKEGIT